MNPEINNNTANGLPMKLRKVSQVSLSSVSDCQSDSSEESSKLERKTSLQDMGKKVEDKRALYKLKGRSMSDGEARKLKDDDANFEVFPSLPNSVLEKLGLRGDGPRERMSEEELEQKFTSLALAFSIDAATIKDRCQRQKRSRDQTEANLGAEMEKLRERLTLMQPLCTDYEKAELFSTIVTQLDTIMNAVSMVSMTAERFGSVQHEERLTESVGLMVSHVQMLKQQRDASRRQLQYTKRVLQNSANSPVSPTKSGGILPPVANRKIISQRRASISTFNEQPSENQTFVENKKIIRRTSDLSLRNAASNNRLNRPIRLDLGGDLVEIKEGCMEMELLHETDIISDTETEAVCPAVAPQPEEDAAKEIDISKLPLKERFLLKFELIKKNVEDKYENLTGNGTLHDVYSFCALFCFSLSLIMLVNIYIEYEYAKWGIQPS
ncbi:unnamed protein product [Phyllotreta striolata]|uniref:Lymphoid-restricted membrane protein n=1 Tax=Phyllotreta striolata TaxID=444603 RepID=A0A9N9TIM4_PHYSR|nr:unnamed protein product [Phyllotreta striolata]